MSEVIEEVVEEIIDVEDESVNLQGYSAYEIAVMNGFEGTEEEWLESLNGEDGVTPNIQIGAVTTLEAGSNATVTRTGTNEEPIFNFGIPRGADGSGSNSDYEDLENKPQINNVELSGNKSLNDLGIQPAGSYALANDIPTNLSQLTEDTTHRTVTDTEKTTWNNKSNFSGSYNDLSDKPTLFSGSYNDLTNKPSIPTKTSDLTNDSNFLVENDLKTINGNSIVGSGDITISGGNNLPIYVLETTNRLDDISGTQSLSNDEKTRYATILTDAYSKEYKCIAIMLCSTTSGKSYMFYPKNIIASNYLPEFYSDFTPKDRTDYAYYVRRRLSCYGTFENGVFVPNGSLSYDPNRELLLTPSNYTAYTVSGNYTPAHKKYVDDAIASAITTTLNGGY